MGTPTPELVLEAHDWPFMMVLGRGGRTGLRCTDGRRHLRDLQPGPTWGGTECVHREHVIIEQESKGSPWLARAPPPRGGSAYHGAWVRRAGAGVAGAASSSVDADRLDLPADMPIELMPGDTLHLVHPGNMLCIRVATMKRPRLLTQSGMGDAWADGTTGKRPRLLTQSDKGDAWADGTAGQSDRPATARRRVAVLVMIGPPGAGKSTFSTALAAAGGAAVSWRRVCQDECVTRVKTMRQAEQALSAGHSVVIDRTNIDRSQRQLWLDLARRVDAMKLALPVAPPGGLQTCIDRCVARQQAGGHPADEKKGPRVNWRELCSTIAAKQEPVDEHDEGFDLVLPTVTGNDVAARNIDVLCRANDVAAMRRMLASYRVLQAGIPQAAAAQTSLDSETGGRVAAATLPAPSSWEAAVDTAWQMREQVWDRSWPNVASWVALVTQLMRSLALDNVPSEVQVWRRLEASALAGGSAHAGIPISQGFALREDPRRHTCNRSAGGSEHAEPTNEPQTIATGPLSNRHEPRSDPEEFTRRVFVLGDDMVLPNGVASAADCMPSLLQSMLASAGTHSEICLASDGRPDGSACHLDNQTLHANLRNGELRLAPNDIAVIVTQLNDSDLCNYRGGGVGWSQGQGRNERLDYYPRLVLDELLRQNITIVYADLSAYCGLRADQQNALRSMCERFKGSYYGKPVHVRCAHLCVSVVAKAACCSNLLCRVFLA
jgi:predicted kinase